MFVEEENKDAFEKIVMKILEHALRLGTEVVVGFSRNATVTIDRKETEQRVIRGKIDRLDRDKDIVFLRDRTTSSRGEIRDIIRISLDGNTAEEILKKLPQQLRGFLVNVNIQLAADDFSGDEPTLVDN